jgi:hypothetical protein
LTPADGVEVGGWVNLPADNEYKLDEIHKDSYLKALRSEQKKAETEGKFHFKDS